jgi:hypothetical protein
MPDEDSHSRPIGGLTGSGKGSVLWRRPAWHIQFSDGAELAEVAPPAPRGRTRRRPQRLGSWLRLPSRRRSRTGLGGDDDASQE